MESVYGYSSSGVRKLLQTLLVNRDFNPAILNDDIWRSSGMNWFEYDRTNLYHFKIKEAGLTGGEGW